MSVRPFRSLILVLLLAIAASGMAPAQTDDMTLVQRALTNELQAASDTQHPMRYRLKKSSPRLTSIKEICETADGAVALLVSVNDHPLSPADNAREQARLNSLLNDPSKQHHRKQSQDEDTGRALKVLRVLPNAFLYQYAGSGEGPTGPVEKFTFKPNPRFDPPDLETQVLSQMTGELWIDPAAERAIRLEGHLLQDVDFGWGILGRLYKGGSILLEQADIGEHQWRVVHFKMVMSGRVIFKTKVFDTTEDEDQYTRIPVGLTYQRGIEMLRASQSHASGTPQQSAQR